MAFGTIVMVTSASPLARAEQTSQTLNLGMKVIQRQHSSESSLALGADDLVPTSITR